MQVGLGLQQDKVNIRGNRFSANRMMQNSELAMKTSTNLRDSYSSGGDQNQLYQMRKDDLSSDYENAIKDVEYDWTQGITDAITGFNAGWEFGNNVVNFY